MKMKAHKVICHDCGKTNKKDTKLAFIDHKHFKGGMETVVARLCLDCYNVRVERGETIDPMRG